MCEFFKYSVLIWSGPEALPSFKDLKTDSTSKGGKEIESREKLPRAAAVGSVAPLSSNTVCAVKKWFNMSALSWSSEKTSSLS